MGIMTRNHALVQVSEDTAQIQLTTMFGEERAMVVGASIYQLQAGFQSYEGGAFIQDAFPMLNASEREFIMTGMIDSEWDELGEDDEHQPTEYDEWMSFDPDC